MNRRIYLLVSVFAIGFLNNLQAAVPDSVWKLPAGQFIPAKMPMHLVYPRPDAETSIHARHKYAYPELLPHICHNFVTELKLTVFR